MRKKNDLISKLAIITAVVGIGTYIYKKIKKSNNPYNNNNDSEQNEDDSSFEIILDDNLENENSIEVLSNDETDLKDENKDA